MAESREEEFVCVYVAAHNVDALILANLMTDAGIAASAVEDHSPAGIFQLGTLAEIHRPKVYVRAADVDAAHQFLDEYESHQRNKATDDNGRSASSDVCPHCLAEVDRDATACPACGGAIDDEDESDNEMDDEEDSDDDDSSAGFTFVQRWKKPLAILLLIGPMLYIVGLLLNLLAWLANSVLGGGP